MGTSRSLSTPSGGPWTGVKQDISSHLGGNSSITPARIVAGTVSAVGTLAVPLVAGGGGRGGGGGGSGATAARGIVSGAASALGGFGADVHSRGFGAALEGLGLGELRGRPAAEVVARISEHLAAGTEGVAGELLVAALSEALFEAARLEGDTSYEALEASLERFLAREGVEGLVALFLERYVFDRVWVLIESHTELRSDTSTKSDGLLAGVEAACVATVREVIDGLRADGRFEGLDWFGADGRRIADGLIRELEQRLREGG